MNRLINRNSHVSYISNTMAFGSNIKHAFSNKHFGGLKKVGKHFGNTHGLVWEPKTGARYFHTVNKYAQDIGRPLSTVLLATAPPVGAAMKVGLAGMDATDRGVSLGRTAGAAAVKQARKGSKKRSKGVKFAGDGVEAMPRPARSDVLAPIY